MKKRDPWAYLIACSEVQYFTKIVPHFKEIWSGMSETQRQQTMDILSASIESKLDELDSRQETLPAILDYYRMHRSVKKGE